MNFEEFQAKNKSGLKFTNISSEQVRYYMKGGSVIKEVQAPIALSVSSSGGHRIATSTGICVYIKPEMWDNIVWKTKEGEPLFVA